MLKCKICEKSCESIINHLFVEHVTTNGVDKTCDICNYTTIKTHHMKRHLNRHNPNRKLIKCPECSREFTVKSCMLNHLWVKHNISKKGRTWHQCTQCSKKYKIKSSLTSHINKKHVNKNTEYKCPEKNCPTNFKTKHKSSLQRHLKIMHGTPTIIKCLYPTCDKKFKDHGNMMQHYRNIHFPTYKYHCNQPGCDKKNKRNTPLLQHLFRVHNIGDLQVFPCSECSKIFKAKGDLHRHLYSIHKIVKCKLHHCSKCSATYARQDRLKTHLSHAHDIGDKICEVLQCKCFKLRKFTDSNGNTVNACGKCYQKAVGFRTRIEQDMVGYLKKMPEIKPYIVLKDKIVSHDSCNTKRRPDVLISSGDIHVIVECDEHQHKSYNPTCEWGRMDEIIDEFKAGKIVFIRWNPHSYVAENRDNQKKRMEKLSNVILETVNKKELPHISVIYMYYDEDNPVICDRWPFELLR